MEISKWEFPDELLYDVQNQWTAVEGNKIRFGLTPYGLEITGEVLYLALPEQGTHVNKDTGCGSLESGKWVGRVYAPVSGKVTAVNTAIVKNPRIINENPYGNWMMEIEIDDFNQLDQLMSVSDLAIWLTEELKKDA